MVDHRQIKLACLYAGQGIGISSMLLALIFHNLFGVVLSIPLIGLSSMCINSIARGSALAIQVPRLYRYYLWLCVASFFLIIVLQYMKIFASHS